MTPFVNKASRLSLFLSPDFIDACRGDGKSDRDECVEPGGYLIAVAGDAREVHADV